MHTSCTITFISFLFFFHISHYAYTPYVCIDIVFDSWRQLRGSNGTEQFNYWQATVFKLHLFALATRVRFERLIRSRIIYTVRNCDCIQIACGLHICTRHAVCTRWMVSGISTLQNDDRSVGTTRTWPALVGRYIHTLWMRVVSETFAYINPIDILILIEITALLTISHCRAWFQC